MAEKDKTQTRSWSDGLKAEFKKIIWPNPKDLTKETTAVVIVSVILGVIITVVDVVMQYGVDFLIK